MKKYKIFVSGVQKELEAERLAISSLITTDPFLTENCEPVLFDREPISGRKASTPYLDCLDTCQVYLLLISREYGKVHGDLSATHHEYRHAQKRKMPTLVFVKGSRDDLREAKAQEFFEEIKKDGFTYKRFTDRLDLQPEVRAALKRLLKESYGLISSHEKDKTGEETLEAVSSFESRETEMTVKALDMTLAVNWLKKISDITGARITKHLVLNALRTRGLVWTDQTNKAHYATAAGIVFLAKNPSACLPHCRIFADAYRGVGSDSKPKDQANISKPAPMAVQAAVDFIKNNTRHPPKIIGLTRVVLDEYPEAAIREAIVNAIAHRSYEDATRQIMVEVFYDKVIISSPGLPPQPLTLAKLRGGKYRPCSRNPVLAQSLALLNLMEQRGSGFLRMKTAMLDHGLEVPQIDFCDGYFQVILPGPADNLERLRLPKIAAVELMPPSVEQRLNGRQKKMVHALAKGVSLTSRLCVKRFGVTRDTAARDFSLLVELAIAEKKGLGRSTVYVFRSRK